VFAGAGAQMLPIDWSDSEHPKAGKPELLVRGGGRGFDAAVSPDGRWLAYNSLETGGSSEIYVQPFPGLQGSSAGKWKISTGGGGLPTWARNARALFFQGRDGRIMSAGYRVEGNSFMADKPQVWSQQVIDSFGTRFRRWDISPDGKRAIVAIPADDKSRKPAHLTFLLNFTDDLRRRVPAGK
jgi:Tol biopolymer transport system component